MRVEIVSLAPEERKIKAITSGSFFIDNRDNLYLCCETTEGGSYYGFSEKEFYTVNQFLSTYRLVNVEFVKLSF